MPDDCLESDIELNDICASTCSVSIWFKFYQMNAAYAVLGITDS